MPAPQVNTNKKTESLFLVVVILLVFNIATSTPTDTDMWWHLRTGDEMWHQGKILLTDEFSYTRFGEMWVNTFWISDLALYGLWNLGGYFAITLTVSLLAIAIMLIVFRQMSGSAYLRGLLVIIAMMGMVANWTPRPQLLSFLLLAGLDYFLNRHINFKRQPLWPLVFLFALWGNLHGGFIWGILLLLATLAGEIFNNLLNNQPKLHYNEIGHLGIWSVFSILAVSANPNGIMLWKLPFQQIDVSLTIQEWLSPDFHQFYAHPLLWLLFLLIVSLAYSEQHMSFTDLIKGLGFTYLFFVAQRNMGPYAIIILPIIAKHFSLAMSSFSKAPILENIKAKILQASPIKQPSEKFNFIINTTLVSLLVIFALINAYAASMPQRIEEKVPARAVAWVKENQPHGPIFNSYNWGGYLTWELRDYPVFIDGRADLYGNEIITQWSEINNGSDQAFSLLDERKINLIFLEPTSPLLKQLPQHGWNKEFSDSKIEIYIRQPPLP